MAVSTPRTSTGGPWLDRCRAEYQFFMFVHRLPPSDPDWSVISDTEYILQITYHDALR
jgi:hypothetical protein